MEKTLAHFERVARDCRAVAKTLKELEALDPEGLDHDALRTHLEGVIEQQGEVIDDVKAMLRRMDALLAADHAPEIEEHRDLIATLLGLDEAEEDAEEEDDNDEDAEEEEDDDDDPDSTLRNVINSLVPFATPLRDLAGHLDFVAVFYSARRAEAPRPGQILITGSNIGGVNVGDRGRTNTTVNLPGTKPRRR